MSNTTSQVESLIQVLRTGSPCASYLAEQELAGLGRVAEIPLINLLREVMDAHRILDILHILQKIKISDPISVDAVVRLLSHKQFLIRKAAASDNAHTELELSNEPICDAI